MQPEPGSLSEASQILLNVAAGDSVPVALRKVGSSEQIRACLPGLEYLIEASQTAVDIIRNLFSDAAVDHEVGDVGSAATVPMNPARPPSATPVVPPPVPATKADQARAKLLEAIERLPHYRDMKGHIAGELAPKYDVERIPRRGSRGNAILYVLQGPARLRPILVDDLLHALQVMGVFEPEDPAARQKLSWEILELQRKKWPVERDLQKGTVVLHRGGTV